MNGSDATTSRIVRWGALPGLSGEGPAPKHFHLKRPTPWSEGFVVRFWNQDGSEWVGNFQGLQDWSTRVVLWPEADFIVVLAMDNFYLVDAGNPTGTSNGVLTVEVEEELGGATKTLRLSVKDGTIL